jgi:hypothetical protein
VQLVSGVLLAAAGAYVAYYGWYEIRIEAGGDPPSGPVDLVGRSSATVTTWVDRVGTPTIALTGLVVALALAGVVVRSRRRTRRSAEIV